MKFHRLHSFLDQWIISLQLYPVTHITILIMTTIWIMLIQQGFDSIHSDLFIKLITTGALMVPLTLIESDYKYSSRLALVVGMIYLLFLPSPIENIVYNQRVWIIGAVIVSWIVPSGVIAWRYKSLQESIWTQFGHRWMSLAQGIVGGCILWGGIAASLASIEFLFEVTITSNIYQYVGIISTLLIGSWIWLINLQQQSEDLLGRDVQEIIQSLTKKGDVNYPRWIRIFGQYIFLPLSGIYGTILISYGIKILATGIRPQGQIVYMVAGYIGFGLLTWFTLLPLEQNHTWLHNIYRGLFGSFVITSGLMIGALVIRVQQYGWSIDRGLVAALIMWTIIMGCGSLIWDRMKWMIGLWSLIIIMLLSMFTIPPIIEKHYLGQTQSILATITPTNTGESTKLYQSLDYLVTNYGTGWTKQVLDTNITQTISGSNTRNFANDVMDALGITGYQNNSYDSRSTIGQWSFYSNDLGSYSIAGYTTMIKYQSYRDEEDPLQQIVIARTTGSNSIHVSGDQINTTINLNRNLNTLKNSNNKEGIKPYMITGSNYQLIITQANSLYSSGDLIGGIGGYLLIR